MKFTKRKDKGTEVEHEIDEHIKRLMKEARTTEDVRKIVGLIKERKELNKATLTPPSTDAILTVAANLLGIVLIISHERVHVITSKAVGFVLRGRV